MAVKHINNTKIITGLTTTDPEEILMETTYEVSMQILTGLDDESLYPEIAAKGKFGDVHTEINTTTNRINNIKAGKNPDGTAKTPPPYTHETMRLAIEKEMHDLRVKDVDGTKVFGGVVSEEVAGDKGNPYVDDTKGVFKLEEVVKKVAELSAQIKAATIKGDTETAKKLQAEQNLFVNIIAIETRSASMDGLTKALTKDVKDAHDKNDCIDKISANYSRYDLLIQEYDTHVPTSGAERDLFNRLFIEPTSDPVILKLRRSICHKIKSGKFNVGDLNKIINIDIDKHKVIDYVKGLHPPITVTSNDANKVFPTLKDKIIVSQTRISNALKEPLYSANPDQLTKMLAPVINDNYRMMEIYAHFPPHITREEYEQLQKDYRIFIKTCGAENVPAEIKQLVNVSYKKYLKMSEHYNYKYNVLREQNGRAIQKILQAAMHKDFDAQLSFTPPPEDFRLGTYEEVKAKYVKNMLVNMGIIRSTDTYPPVPSTLSDSQKIIVARVEKDVRDVITGELCTKDHDKLVKQMIEDGCKTTGSDPTASARLAQDKAIRTEILLEDEADKVAAGITNPAEAMLARDNVYKTSMQAHYMQACNILYNMSMPGAPKPTRIQIMALASVFQVDKSDPSYDPENPETWKFLHETDATSGKVTYKVRDDVPVSSDPKAACMTMVHCVETVTADQKLEIIKAKQEELDKIKGAHPFKKKALENEIKQLKKELQEEYEAEKDVKENLSKTKPAVTCWSSPKARIKYYENLLASINAYLKNPVVIPEVDPEETKEKITMARDKARSEADKEKIKYNANRIVFKMAQKHTKEAIKAIEDKSIFNDLAAKGIILTDAERDAIVAGVDLEYALAANPAYTGLTPADKTALQNKSSVFNYITGTKPLPRLTGPQKDELKKDSPNFASLPEPYKHMTSKEEYLAFEERRAMYPRLQQMDKKLNIINSTGNTYNQPSPRKIQLRKDLINELETQFGRPLTTTEKRKISKTPAKIDDILTVPPLTEERKTQIKNNIKAKQTEYDSVPNRQGDEYIAEVYGVYNIEIGKIEGESMDPVCVDIANSLNGTVMDDYMEIATELWDSGKTDIDAAIAACTPPTIDALIDSLPTTTDEEIARKKRLLEMKAKLKERAESNPEFVIPEAPEKPVDPTEERVTEVEEMDRV